MTVTTHNPDFAPDSASDSESASATDPTADATAIADRPRGTYERPSVVLTRGKVDMDPQPTPIDLRTIRTVARKTWRNERKNYAKLGRRRRLTSKRLAAS